MKRVLSYCLFVLILTGFSNSEQKYVLSCNEGLLEASMDTALAQVGTYERKGNNDGDVEKYLNADGLIKGSPYCAAGQYYCFYVAARSLKMNINNVPIKRTGLANEMFNDAMKKGKPEPFKPHKHDLIVWRRGITIFGHIERIFMVYKAGWVVTVGFNVRKFDRLKNKYVEGVFIMKRNVYEPLGRMRVRGLIGFIPEKVKK
jgi:hypothetical protein